MFVERFQTGNARRVGRGQRGDGVQPIDSVIGVFSRDFFDDVVNGRVRAKGKRIEIAGQFEAMAGLRQVGQRQATIAEAVLQLRILVIQSGCLRVIGHRLREPARQFQSVPLAIELVPGVLLTRAQIGGVKRSERRTVLEICGRGAQDELHARLPTRADDRFQILPEGFIDAPSGGVLVAGLVSQKHRHAAPGSNG